MAEHSRIGNLYDVETDIADWPKGLPEVERPLLTAIVLDVLRKFGPLGTHDLYRRVSDHADVGTCPTFRKAAVYDFLYGCVVRAARAGDCEQRWHAPAKR